MIYLDNAANEPVLPEALDAMLPWLSPDRAGNPDSVHTRGVLARRAVEEARGQVAALINADPSEIFFTSGGTEANNMWFSLSGDQVVVTARTEHASVLRPLKIARKDIGLVATDGDGVVSPDSVRRWLGTLRDTSSVGVSVMWVNNETGAVNPIRFIAEICRSFGVHFHTDAVQAAGHVPIDVKADGVDALSISGHKLGAPMGVGALYLKGGSSHGRPLIIGGGQERELRAGTPNVPGIVGFGKAAEVALRRLDANLENWVVCRRAFLDGMDGSGRAYRVNGGAGAVPNIISLTLPGVHSESLLMLLDQRGVCVSAGSACGAASGKPSHVLKAIGLSNEDAACTIRISMGFDTTPEEMRLAAGAVAEAADFIENTVGDGSDPG